MVFFTDPSVRVPAEGPEDALIAFVGEAPGREEVRQGRPLVGPSGGIFDQCLRASKIIRSDCYITNVIKEKLPRNDENGYLTVKKDTATFTKSGAEAALSLQTELSTLPEIRLVVTMGNTALAACTYDHSTNSGRAGISTRRGYRIDNSPVGPLLPTLHPAHSIHKDYLSRYHIAHDFAKARKIINGELSCDMPRLIFPKSLEEAKAILEGFFNCPEYSVDIEVYNYEVSCIGFCSDTTTISTDVDGTTYKGITYSIPIHGIWSESEELELWRCIAGVLENPSTAKIFQNGIFDCGFLASRNGILPRGELKDTMVASHVMYPDFLKGLNFIASVHCNLPYWKDMVSFKNIKGDS